MLQRISRFLTLGLVPQAKLYVSAVPLVLLASVASYVAPGDFELSINYLLANLVSLLVVAGVYFAGARLLGRLADRRADAVRFALVGLIGFGLALGVTKQLSTAWIVAALGLEADFFEAAIMRSITPLLGVWYVLALAVISAGQARFSKLREELIAERVRKLSNERIDTSELKNFADGAQQLLSTAAESSSLEVAALIRSIVQDQLRPLSHRLWDREQDLTPGFSARELAIRALQFRPYRVWRIVPVYALGSIAPIVVLAADNWPMALAVLVGSTTLVLLLANFLRRRSDFAKQQFVFTLVASATLSVSATFGLLALLGFASSTMLWLSSAWWIGTLIVVVGMLVVALEDYGQQRRMLAELANQEISSAAQGAIRAIRNRELANLLHSKTQNRMLAQAMRLEAGANLADELTALKTLLAKLPALQAEELTAEELAARWQGILEIDFQLERPADQLILRVCEEAITNAMRHGLATRILVVLKQNELIVTDDGLGPVSGSEGLGSSLYSSAGTWSLSALAEGGAQLRVLLP